MTPACPSQVLGAALSRVAGEHGRSPGPPGALPCLSWPCGRSLSASGSVACCTGQLSAEYLRASPCSSPELCVQPLPACPSSSSLRLPTLTALSHDEGVPALPQLPSLCSGLKPSHAKSVAGLTSFFPCFAGITFLHCLVFRS